MGSQPRSPAPSRMPLRRSPVDGQCHRHRGPLQRTPPSAPLRRPDLPVLPQGRRGRWARRLPVTASSDTRVPTSLPPAPPPAPRGALRTAHPQSRAARRTESSGSAADPARNRPVETAIFSCYRKWVSERTYFALEMPRKPPCLACHDGAASQAVSQYLSLYPFLVS